MYLLPSLRSTVSLQSSLCYQTCPGQAQMQRKVHSEENSMYLIHIIGASLNEPHVNGATLPAMYILLLW
jgi:hypothetical protein